MKTKRFTCLVLSALLSSSAFAASPFLVSHTMSDTDGGRSVNKTSSNKSNTTLAESLVHLKHHCDRSNRRQSQENDTNSTSVVEQSHPEPQ